MRTAILNDTYDNVRFRQSLAREIIAIERGNDADDYRCIFDDGIVYVPLHGEPENCVEISYRDFYRIKHEGVLHTWKWWRDEHGVIFAPDASADHPTKANGYNVAAYLLGAKSGDWIRYRKPLSLKRRDIAIVEAPKVPETPKATRRRRKVTKDAAEVTQSPQAAL